MTDFNLTSLSISLRRCFSTVSSERSILILHSKFNCNQLITMGFGANNYIAIFNCRDFLIDGKRNALSFEFFA
jgi:hypothetical protein